MEDLTPMKRIEHLVEKANQIASDELGVRINIFRNAKYLEVIAASMLGHAVNCESRGPDAYEVVDGVSTPTEYKSAQQGGCFQFHWLSNTKMDRIQGCRNTYFIVTEKGGTRIMEIYKLETGRMIDEITRRSTGSRSINGHKSFALKYLLQLGAEKVF